MPKVDISPVLKTNYDSFNLDVTCLHTVARKPKNFIFTVLKSPLSDKKSREQFLLQQKGYAYLLPRNSFIQTDVLRCLHSYLKKHQVLSILHFTQNA